MTLYMDTMWEGKWEKCSCMKWTGGQWQRGEKVMNQEMTVMMRRRKRKEGKRPRNPRDQDRTPHKGQRMRR